MKQKLKSHVSHSIWECLAHISIWIISMIKIIYSLCKTSQGMAIFFVYYYLFGNLGMSFSSGIGKNCKSFP